MIDEIIVKIEGLNLSRLVTKLINSGVMLTDLKTKNTSITFKISKLQEEKLKKICKSEYKKYRIISKSKIERFFKKIPHYFTIVVLFIFVSCYFYATSSIITQINIKNLNSNIISDNEILKILNDNNIHIGASKNSFNVKDIEKILILNCEDISATEIYYEGTKLNISVLGAKTNENLFKKQLVSNFDAKITEIEVYAGNSLLKVGDIIKKGDILVSSDTESKAKIKGKVYLSVTRIYNEVCYEEVQTGNTQSQKILSVGNFLPLEKTKKCNFLNFKTQTKTKILFQNVFLPIFEIETIYSEINLVEKVVPFVEVEIKIKTELENELKSQFASDYNFENITFSVVGEGHFTRIDCFGETIVDLCN